MRKQRFIVVLVVTFLLTIAIGFVIFKTNIDVEVQGKTASAKNLEVIFKDVGTPTEVYSTEASAVISENKKTLNIYVPNLTRKGSYAEFPVTIKNTGVLPAKLQTINQYSIGSTLVFVSYRGINVLDDVFQPNEERTFYVKVSLLKDVPVPSVKFDFQINFNYIQAK